MSLLSSIIAPSPNGELGGLTFQNHGGIPTAFAGRRPSFAQIAAAAAPPTAMNPNAPNLSNQADKRSNNVIQHARVVPMASAFDRALVGGLQRGSLVFTIPTNQKEMNNTIQITSEDGVSLKYATRGGLPDTNEKIVGSLGNRARLTMYDSQQISEIIGWPMLCSINDERVKIATIKKGTDDYQNPVAGMLVSNVTKLLKDRAVLMVDGLDFSTNVKAFTTSAFLCPQKYARAKPWGECIRTDDETTNKIARDKLKLIELMEVLQGKLLSRESIGYFVPDGMIINKYETEGNDAAAEAFLNASQHGLFNIAVGGVSLCTSWAEFNTNRKRDETTLPGHELYILVVGTPVELTNTTERNDVDQPRGFDDNFTGKTNPAFANLRFQRATTMEMTHLTSKKKATGTDAQQHAPVKSYEVVLGAWRVGSILDTAAAPLDIGGVTIGAKSTKAMMANVQIKWVHSIDLFETFDYGNLV